MHHSGLREVSEHLGALSLGSERVGRILDVYVMNVTSAQRTKGLVVCVAKKSAETVSIPAC